MLSGWSVSSFYHISATVQNRTHVHMDFFAYNHTYYHFPKYCRFLLNHPVYTVYIHIYIYTDTHTHTYMRARACVCVCVCALFSVTILRSVVKSKLQSCKLVAGTFIFMSFEASDTVKIPWSSRWNWSLHLFFWRPTFLFPLGLYCSACLGILLYPFSVSDLALLLILLYFQGKFCTPSFSVTD